MKRFLMVLILVLVSVSISFADTVYGIGSPYGVTPTGTGTLYINTTNIPFWKANSSKQGDFTKILTQEVVSTGEFVASSTSANIGIEKGLILMSAGSASDVATLADGFEGQKVVLVLSKLESSAKIVVTVTNGLNVSTLTFDALGETATLVFADGKWILINGTATAA